MKVKPIALFPLLATALFCAIAFRDISSWSISVGLVSIIVLIGTGCIIAGYLVTSFIGTLLLTFGGRNEYDRTKRNDYLVRLLISVAAASACTFGYVMTINSLNANWLAINFLVAALGLLYTGIKTYKNPAWIFSG